MQQSIVLSQELNSFVFASNDEIKTTSLLVAEKFGKLHKDVLRKIQMLDCSEDFAKRNFALSKYEVSGGKNTVREESMYEMTKDGFMFLVMGFTGKAAAQVKEAYINAFNAMHAKLLPKRNALVELPAVCVTPNEKLQLQKMINARVHRTKESHSMAWHILFDAYRVNKMECLPTGRVDEMCAYMGERVPHQDEMVLIKKHELDELKTAAAQEMRLPKGSVVIDETYLKTLHHGVIERDAFQIKSMIEKHGGLLLWQEQIDVLKSVLKLD